MGYTANIEGFEGQTMEVEVSFWSGPKLLINNQPAQKGSKRGEMLLQRNDGRQVSAIWKPQGFGMDVPQLVVDGKTVKLVEPLKWYHWLWSGLPIGLVFVGGALGALIGVLAFAANARMFRSGLNGFLKFVATGLISVLAVILFYVLATVLYIWING